MVDVAGIGVKTLQNRHEHLSKELEPFSDLCEGCISLCETENNLLCQNI